MASDLLPHGMFSIDPATKEEMLTYSTRKGHPCEYVPSGIRTPSYRSMGKESLEYYLHWRDSVRRGRFPMTDIGYIRTLFSEIVTLNSDPENDLQLMARIVREYAHLNIFQMRSLGDVCVCHARINGLGLPRLPILKDENVIAYQTYQAMASRPIGYLSVRNLMALFRIDTAIPDGVPIDALYRRIVAEADTMTSNICGNRLSDGVGTVKRNIPVYGGLIYHGNRRTFTVSIPLNILNTSMGEILESTLRMMLVGLGCDGVSQEYRDEGIAYEATVKVLEDYRSGTLVLDDPDAEFKLDPKKITESEDDLRAVTEMMRVEDGDTEVAVKAPDVERTPLTGWAGLAESLDDIMIGYLVAAQDGTVKEFLVGNGLKMGALEKDINTLAMDMVGDIIVEDGTIIDDYTDEVSELTGCRGYRRERS